jgi:hypothetical protein
VGLIQFWRNVDKIVDDGDWFLSGSFNISMNDANAQDHVPQIERTNRVIKERVRAAFHSLPSFYAVVIVCPFMEPVEVFFLFLTI